MTETINESNRRALMLAEVTDSARCGADASASTVMTLLSMLDDCKDAMAAMQDAQERASWMAASAEADNLIADVIALVNESGVDWSKWR